jgi:hypothetical protein
MRPNEAIYNSELAQKILSANELTPDTAESVTMIWANPKIKDALESGQSESFRGYANRCWCSLRHRRHRRRYCHCC